MSIHTILDIERERLLDALYANALKLNDDELRVLHRCSKGLVKGRTKYAPWDPSKETRNLAEEALQESLDMSVYLSMLADKEHK